MSRRLAQLTVSQQVLAGCGTITAVMAALVLFANTMVGGVATDIDRLTSQVQPAALKLLNVDRDGYQAQLALERVVYAPLDDSGRKEALEAWEENSAQTESRFEEFKGMAVGLDGEAERIVTVDRLRGEWLGLARAALAAEQTDAVTLLPGVRAAFESYRNEVDVLEEQGYEAEAEVLVGDVDGGLRQVAVGNWVALGAALLAAVGVSLVVARRLRRQVVGRVAQLLGASKDLTGVAEELAATAERTASQARDAERSAGDVTESVDNVSGAVDELSSSIREIATNTSAATTVAAEAVSTAADAARSISQLGQSSQQIEEVVKVITSIAEQTNLLALNATIEAARAGEAGKGFTVVATEVKDLAAETARATGEIAARVAAIQHDTAAAITANQRINDIIERIAELQHSIAAAVEEQSVTTGEIARSLAAAAQGAGRILGNVGALAEQASEADRMCRVAGDGAASLTEIAAGFSTLVESRRA